MSKVWLITGASRGLGRALTEAVFVTVEFDFLDPTQSCRQLRYR
jgi:hypothetical protein